jgi:hypothetical protein
MPKTDISWGHDLEVGLRDARSTHKNVLLDFSAAPM